MAEEPDVFPTKIAPTEVAPAREIPVQELPEGQSSTLAEMRRDYTFFTTALILTHAMFDRDPLVEFTLRHPAGDPNLLPFAIDYERPLFQDLGITMCNGQPVNWDHRLYGIHNSRWELCFGFLTGLLILDRRNQRYSRIGCHALKIVDVFALQNMGFLTELPTVDITVFCVSGNRQFTYLAPAVDPPRTHPFPKGAPPREDVVAEAAVLLEPPPDPTTLKERLDILLP